MKHYRIRVSGKVQGVFYRASTQEKAQVLNLSGWVKNEADGSVSIEAEGSEANLEQLLEWCRSGPPRATVDQVDFVEGALQHYDGFIVKR